MSWKKWLLRLINRMLRPVGRCCVSLLPRGLRHRLYRSTLCLPEQLDDNLVIKIADTREELEEAFKLLHSAYVKQGFIQPSSSGLYLTTKHGLLSTSTLVAKINGEVVGTISLVRDSALGLPLEKAFSVDKLRKSGARVAEVSSLAISPKMRREVGGQILFPLFTYMFRYAEQYYGLDSLVIAIYPHHGEWYESLFGYQLLCPPIDDYMGAPAAAYFMNLKSARVHVAQWYAGRTKNRDLYHFAFDREFTCFHFPKRKYATISDPVLTPELLEYFFLHKTDLLKKASPWEIKVLRDQYRGQAYDRVFSQCTFQAEQAPRDQRFEVSFPGRIILEKVNGNENSLLLQVLNVSQNGFKAILSRQLRLRDPLKFQLAIHTFEIVELEAVPVWRNQDGTHGFRIKQSSKEWQKFIEYLAIEACGRTAA